MMAFAQMQCILIFKLPVSLMCAPTLPEAPPTPALVHGKPAALRTQASAPDVFSLLSCLFGCFCSVQHVVAWRPSPFPRLFFVIKSYLHLFQMCFFSSLNAFFFCLSLWFALKFAKLEGMNPPMQMSAFASLTPNLQTVNAGTHR